MNGIESGRSKPVQVAIGASGYVTLAYWTACSAGTSLPFPYTFAQMDVHLYYRDPATGIDHEFGYYPNPGANFAEVEFKLPVVAKDGFVVPLVAQTGYYGYYYTWKTPDMAQTKEDNFMPVFQSDSVSYSQTNIRRVQFGEDCPMAWEKPGGDYVWHQNVTR